MGCGGSKGAEVKNATMATTVAEAPTTTETNKADASAPAQNTQAATTAGSASQNTQAQSKPEENDNNANAADEGMNPSVDLSVTGRKLESRGGSRKQTATPPSDDDDDDSRMTSAVSTRSAPPMIMERPSSRGGRAFEISFDGDGDGTRKPPRRLQKLQHSSKRRKGDLTLDQLQRKLEAAEKRKKEYEQRILEKISVDTKRPADKRDKNVEEQAKVVEQKVEEKVDKAMKNREAHLRNLREKLRARDEHRSKVQEKKQQIKESGITPEDQSTA